MKTHQSPNSLRPGLTLLEVTVVIAASLVLIGIAFLGAKAWQHGAERTSCIMNISKVQKSVRAFSAEKGYEPGMVIGGGRASSRWRVSASGLGVPMGGSRGAGEENFVLSKITGEGNYLARQPFCAGGGDYSTLEDRIPEMGQLYLRCSLANDLQHYPADTAGW